MPRDNIQIKRLGNSRYLVTNLDGSKDNFIARDFVIKNGFVKFYDKMAKLVKAYSSDNEIEIV